MRVYQILTSPISFHFVLYFTENKSDLDFKKTRICRCHKKLERFMDMNGYFSLS